MSIYAEYAHGVIDKAEFDYLANIENRKERDYEERITSLPYGCDGKFGKEECENCPQYVECECEAESEVEE